MDATTAWYALAVLLGIVGLLGIVLPLLPGIPILFVAMWLAAWAGDFAHVGLWPLLILAKLAVLSILVDLLATVMGARRVGASTAGIIGAGLGTVAGLALGLAGVLIGPFVGAVLGELAAGRRLDSASRAGFGSWVGLIVGTAVKLAIAFAMLGVFAVSWWL